MEQVLIINSDSEYTQNEHLQKCIVVIRKIFLLIADAFNFIFNLLFQTSPTDEELEKNRQLSRQYMWPRGWM